MASQHSTTADFSSRYKFNAKELDKETGWYYYGARYYDPQVSTWLSVDPLAEKYAGFSPYNFTLGNPVMLVDVDGMGVETDYILDKKTGKVTRKDPNDGSEKNKNDRLYATDDNGNVTNKYIQIDKDKANDNTVISDLAWEDSNGNSMSLDNTNADAVYKTFLFAANNSDVEWETGRTRSNTYFISTAHNTEFSPSSSDMMMSNKDIFAYVHSHPNIDTSFSPRYQKYLTMYGYNKGMYYEISSMGYTIEYGNTDWNQVKKEVNNYNHYINYRYVYIPKSGRLWQVGYYNPVYIRNIKNNYKRLFFGTLNK